MRVVGRKAYIAPPPVGYASRAVLVRVARIAVVWSWLLTLTLSSGSAAQTFTDVTIQAGVDYVQSTADPDSVVYGEIMTGGAAARDFNRDGLPDLFVTVLDGPDILYQNLGNDQDGLHLGFQSVHAGQFTATNSNGVGWGDVNNDGNPDLYVTAMGTDQHSLYINQGNNVNGVHQGFVEEALARGAALDDGVTNYGMSVAFGDYDKNGELDAMVGEWRLNWWLGEGNEGALGNARLLQNTGSGFFQDRTAFAGVALDGLAGAIRGSTFEGDIYGFSPRFVDMDGDGDQDLAIAADYQTTRLFLNDGDGTFTDASAPPLGTDQSGMGSYIGDFNLDGRPDWFITSIYGVDNGFPFWIGNRLYQNNGTDETGVFQGFTDVTEAVGVEHGSWGWGASALDYNNDGRPDLVMTNGWGGVWEDDQMRLFEQSSDGTYTDVATAEGITDTRQGRGLVVFDYDLDGDEDVFVANVGDHPTLYRNDLDNGNDWLQVEVEGTLSNRDGIGAVVRVTVGGTTYVREIDGGSNFLSQNDLPLHFGLGDLGEDALIDRFEVYWPASGILQSFTDVAANQRYLVTEMPTPGDMDRDGDVDFDDIDDFVSGLNDPTGYESTFGVPPSLMGDCDGDGDQDFDDIAGFVDILSGGPLTTPVPEPSSLTLLVLAGIIGTLVRCFITDEDPRTK